MKIKDITEGIKDTIGSFLLPDPNKGDTANPYGAFAQQSDKNPFGSFSQQAANAVRGATLGNPFTQYRKPAEQDKMFNVNGKNMSLTEILTRIDELVKVQQPSKDEQVVLQSLINAVQGDKGAMEYINKLKSKVPDQPAATTTAPSQPAVQGQEQPQDTQQPGPTTDPIDTEAEKANANIKSKIAYLVKQGVLQSGRITDTERQYIDSVDVYVDPNKFANTDPSEVYIQATPPHPSNYGASVTIPLSKWMEAQGRDGSPFTGYVGFNRTPAGWWTDDYKAYVNPRNDLDNLIASYRKK